MMDFTIVTKLRVYDEDRDYEDEDYALRLVEEQSEKERVLGLVPAQGKCLLVHFFNSSFFDDVIDEFYSLDEAVQYLAIKDGIDLVQWANGNYGYVAYYNGETNGFEIIG